MVASVYFFVFLSLFSIASAGNLEYIYKNRPKEFNSALQHMTAYEITREQMDNIPWKCGPNTPAINALTKLFAETACYQGVVNIAKYACAKHDNCYNCQRGQSYCDHKFCAILSTAMTLTNANWGCRWTSPIACSAVKKSGALFYANSKNDVCDEEMDDELAV